MPKGSVQAAGENRHLLGLAVAGDAAEDPMSPALVSATKKSPLGAVRIMRGLSSPAAYCSTLKPAGTCGHAPSGRATTLGPLPADGVAKGAGRSFSVILRTCPGLLIAEVGERRLRRRRVQLRGSLGAPAGLLLATAALRLTERLHVADDLPALLLGNVAQDGMPLFTSPLVMNQKISPGVTALILSAFSGGIFPEPSPFSPWQRAQRRW